MILARLAELLGEPCHSVHSLRGGDTAAAFRVETGHRPVFVKYSANGRADAEADGLGALAQTGVVRVPEVLAADAHLLVLEWIEPHPFNPRASRALGEALAALHSIPADHFGYTRDNWIGGSVQSNTPDCQWGTFFVRERLRPQLRPQWGSWPARLRDRAERLLERIETELNQLAPSAVLLHGDLWSGNALCTTGGRPVLIDPAVYYGHGEADLAMTRLFGGFGHAFYDAYRCIHPTETGSERREAVYNWYHVLNHANLFGGEYVRQAIDVVHHYG